MFKMSSLYYAAEFSDRDKPRGGVISILGYEL